MQIAPSKRALKGDTMNEGDMDSAIWDSMSPSFVSGYD